MQLLFRRWQVQQPLLPLQQRLLVIPSWLQQAGLVSQLPHPLHHHLLGIRVDLHSSTSRSQELCSWCQGPEWSQ
jgi:hypothetical protein